MKLSKAQERALFKLSPKYQSVYKIQERVDTLDILVAKRLAESKSRNGVLFYPKLKQYRITDKGLSFIKSLEIK